jgi:SRSO17 transposase
MSLHLPPSWDDAADPQCVLRRQKTRVPPEAHHREKWQMALEMIDLARQAGVPHRGVAADAWYGNITAFRQQLAEWH